MISRTLLIYAKPPRMGLSKTRLARGLGKTEAMRIARMCMGRTIRAATDQRWESVLYPAPDTYMGNTLGGLWPASLPRASQGHGDLTDRMNKGFDEASAGAIVIVGTDIPDISTALIWQAFQSLRGHDAVFGPAWDGGFWLFGMNKRSNTHTPFGNVRWSSPHAMEDVWSHLPDHMSVGLLPKLIDIDEAEDWHQWRAEKN
ncbi:MAG: TIGR04282 family arsenosugar biosynthesis glycosyltransferase [Hyphomonadaceae bacterium]